MLEAATSVRRRYRGSSQESKGLDRAGTLYRIGVIVDQNVRCRTAKTPAFTIRRDARREARGDRSAHDRASRYGPFACLLE